MTGLTPDLGGGDARVPRRVTPFSGVPAAPTEGLLRFPHTPEETSGLVSAALREDHAQNDLTSIAIVASARTARAMIVSRAAGVVAGVPLALEAFRQLDQKLTIRIDVEDGERVEPGTGVLFISGHARAILAAERVALNYLQRLSGIASLTAQYVALVQGTRAKILDTRKTTPGWRALEKYAVRAGGGTNHRNDLESAILIKDNHLAAVEGDVRTAVRRAREYAPAGTQVEVECDRFEQVEAAMDAGADIVMLDNMGLDEMRACVAFVAGRAVVEASGGVRLDTVRAIAETGVDWISVGALTHSAPALDLGLDFD